jgi:hypothetical protein
MASAAEVLLQALVGHRNPFDQQTHQSSVHRYRGQELQILHWIKDCDCYHTVGVLGWGSSNPAGMAVRTLLWSRKGLEYCHD